MNETQNFHLKYPPLIDPFGRQLTYLRIAVTDRCNLRCTYCMPEEGVPFIPHERIIRFEELYRIVAIMSGSGISKIRITGGEPFVRKGLMDFFERIAALDGLRQIHLTTNGVLIHQYIGKLKRLGVSGINLSMDTLNTEKFKTITRREGWEQVWKSFRLVMEYGIPLKINSVIQRGINDDEIEGLARLAEEHPIQVRFIEQMPFNGLIREFRKPFTALEIKERLENVFGELYPENNPGSTAQLFSIPGFAGKIGIIAGYSRTFCDSCNRLRITSTGILKTCLYDRGSIDLKTLVRNGADDAKLYEAIADAVAKRHRDGFEAEEMTMNILKQSMAQIGG